MPKREERKSVMEKCLALRDRKEWKDGNIVTIRRKFRSCTHH
jgi:hypothetical protein